VKQAGGRTHCGVAVIRRGREFLIAKRRANDSFGSFWEFPGGSKLPEESLKDCVLREIREELDIEIKVIKKIFSVPGASLDRKFLLHFFLCDYVSGDPKPLESEKVEWVDLTRLGKFKFPPANYKVIDRLISDEKAGK
jgi:A/G-specific adenine glycosylase